MTAKPSPRLLFDAFLGANPFIATHWHDGEIYGDTATDWYAQVVLWGGPQSEEACLEEPLWSDYTDADDDVERAYEALINAEDLWLALVELGARFERDPFAAQALGFSVKARYEIGRWASGNWVGHGVDYDIADQVLQFTAMWTTTGFRPRVLFTS